MKRKIIDEIERLIEANKTKNGFPAGTICAARIEAYEILLKRIDSLPSETSGEMEVVNDLTEGPIKAVRLPDGRYVTEKLAREIEKIIEQELERYARENWEFNEVLRKEVPFDVEDCKWCDLVAFARHFAQWGAEHAKKEEYQVSDDLEEAAGEWYEKCPFPKSTWWDEGEEMKLTDSRETFIAGANWQKEQMEKNRLAACDKMTKEEYERETAFVDEILGKENRQPTFSDAIEYGMRLQKEQMLKDAEDGEVVKDINNKLAVTAKINLDGFKFGDKVRVIIVKED